MKLWSKRGFFVSAFSVFIFFLSSSVTALEDEHEREFDYNQGSDKGPENWGELKEEWVKCKNGTMQSPIDLSFRRIKVLRDFGNLSRTYKGSDAYLINRGHDISIKWDGDAGSVNINGTEYRLQQCHWHSPSEHTINGRRFALELHMVHQSLDPYGRTRTVVVSFLYKIGLCPDSFLSEINEDMREMIFAKTKKKKIGVVNPSQIAMNYIRYFKYMGSFTIPPCTEGVTWIISEQLMPVSWYQVQLLRAAVHDYARNNARPLQQSNGRDIQLYWPRHRLRN